MLTLAGVTAAGKRADVVPKNRLPNKKKTGYRDRSKLGSVKRRWRAWVYPTQCPAGVKPVWFRMRFTRLDCHGSRVRFPF